MSLTYGYDLKDGDKNVRSTGRGLQNNDAARHTWSSASQLPPILCASRLSPLYASRTHGYFKWAFLHGFHTSATNHWRVWLRN